MRRVPLPALAAVLASVSPAAAREGEAVPACDYGICRVQMTAQQMLAHAEGLVRARRFAEAEPYIAALAQAPDMRLQSRFLAGYAAAESGEHARAASIFKAILADDPAQTRVRLELARTMLQLRQYGSADRQFRIAEQTGELPPDVAAVIRGARRVIRSRRPWRLDVDLGIAPDSNINNATGADRIDVFLGDVTLPVELDRGARARSGVGQAATVIAGLRLPVGEATSVLATLDANGTNYAGTAFDDYLVQAAGGAERRFGEASISLEGLVASRWFGGAVASRQAGARAGLQLAFDARTRLGIQVEGRRTDAVFDANWSGWQTGAYVTGERGVGRSLVASLGGFARRDWLRAAAYSSTEVGVTAGMGGELPLGITFGAGANLSRADFDAAMPIFSPVPRRDWRYGGRLTIGNRAVRVLGFSPQATVSYTANASNVAFFATDRFRVRLGVARYF